MFLVWIGIGIIIGVVGTFCSILYAIHRDIYYSKSDWKNVTIKDGATENNLKK